MKNWILFSILMTTLVALVECSNHARTVDTQVTSDEVFSRLELLTTGEGEQSESVAEMAKSNKAVVYYSRAPGQFGQIQNVADIKDYAALGFNFGSQDVVTDAELFFVDNVDAHPRFKLLIALKRKDHSRYESRVFEATGEPRIEKSKFEVTLSDGDSTSPHVIRIKSNDVDPARQLQGVIQMKLSAADGRNIGKFPTLAGYAH